MAPFSGPTTSIPGKMGGETDHFFLSCYINSGQPVKKSDKVWSHEFEILCFYWGSLGLENAPTGSTHGLHRFQERITCARSVCSGDPVELWNWWCLGELGLLRFPDSVWKPSHFESVEVRWKATQRAHPIPASAGKIVNLCMEVRASSFETSAPLWMSSPARVIMSILAP